MKRSEIPTSAHTGLTDWLVQRATSLYMAGFVIYLAWHFGSDPAHDHDAWRAWFAQGLVRIAWALFFASVLLHAWVGLRSIYMDYLRPLWLRFSITLLTAFGLASLALWVAQILLNTAAA